jgi:seryl-tRNA synthetase
MLSREFIRKNPQLVVEVAKIKRVNVNIEKILELDKKIITLQKELDDLRHILNEKSKEIGKMKKAWEDFSKLREQLKDISEKVSAKETEKRALEEEINELLQWIPNIFCSDVPDGEDSTYNQIEYEWGEKKSFDFQPLNHYEIAKKLKLIDFERGAKLSGSDFPLFTGNGARLVFALLNFMIDVHQKEHSYTFMYPPSLVKSEIMYGTGQLPKMKDDMYYLENDKLYLIPTAEVPITNIFKDEILSWEDLPIKVVAFSQCFRREAGAAGKKTLGITRVHQFDKIELVKFVHPDEGEKELISLRYDAEDILKKLNLPYRVVKLCKGDTSFASAKTYDLEAFAPGINTFLEVSSCSLFLDFQARRINIRFRDKDKKVKFVYTINGSGLAIPRTFIALVENYQTKEGYIKIPDALKPYIGCDILK